MADKPHPVAMRTAFPSGEDVVDLAVRIKGLEAAPKLRGNGVLAQWAFAFRAENGEQPLVPERRAELWR